MATNATKNKKPNYGASLNDGIGSIANVVANVGREATQTVKATTPQTTYKTTNPPVSDYQKGLGNGFEMKDPVIDMTPGSPNYGQVVSGDKPPTTPYGGGISGSANFRPSEAYNQAMAYTNQLLSQLSSGRTSYTDQINSLMDTINNRASFSYDPDNDPLFQQYLASSMESGKTAMQDTMAQASALTGGYGSSYATAVANGAYNNYVQDAYNNLPEYYQTALDAYNTETSNLYNKLGMFNNADQTEYGRLMDAYQNNFAMANDIYGKDYNNYWDKLNYDTSIAQYNQDLAYKYANLAQDQAQFEANLAVKNKQGEENMKDPTEAQYKHALELYNAEGPGSGMDAVEGYATTLDDDIKVEKLAEYVLKYGRARTDNDRYVLKDAMRN